MIGRTVAGKYAIVDLVGEGAMGAVYRAHQIALGTSLALKVLHPKHASDPMFAARFLREAQAASRVDHPNSIRVLDFGQEPDGLLYLAMEYLDGKTLAKLIEEESPLPVARIVDIAGQVLAALAVAHDLGVVHRDLKPENIMVLEGRDDEGRVHDVVKVCDFGVAKLLESDAAGPSVTADGIVIGTPEYMSPEQAKGQGLDARSDLYAMGVLLFQLMTGKVPFDSSTAFGTALMHVNDEPTRPRVLNPRVDARLEKICLKAMRKRPEERYGSAREFRAELRALLESPSEATLPPPLLAQMNARPRRTGLVVAGVTFASLAAVGAYFYGRPVASVMRHERMQNTSITRSVLSPAEAMPSPITAPPGTKEMAAPNPSSGVASAVAEPMDVTETRARPHHVQKPHARRTKPRIGLPSTLHGQDSLPPLPSKEAPPRESPSAKDPPAGASDGDPADLPLPVFPIPSVEDSTK